MDVKIERRVKEHNEVDETKERQKGEVSTSSKRSFAQC